MDLKKFKGRTKNGAEYVIFVCDQDLSYPIIGKVKTPTGSWSLTCWDSRGDCAQGSGWNLIPITVKDQAIDLLEEILAQVKKGGDFPNISWEIQVTECTKEVTITCNLLKR